MKKHLVLVTIVLPLLGAWAGYLAGPFVARMDDTVSLAGRIWKEESRDLNQRTFESMAFRETGRSAGELYAAAREIVDRISIATALFGAWCGLVVGVQLAGLLRKENRDIYEIEYGQCVVCARCFHVCPREKKRREERRQWRQGDEGAPLRRLLDRLEDTW